MRVVAPTLKYLLVAVLVAAGLLTLFVPARPAFALIPATGDITDNNTKSTSASAASPGVCGSTGGSSTKDSSKTSTPDPACQNVTCLNGVQVANGTKGGKQVPSGTDCALENGDCSDPSSCDLIQHYINPAIDFAAALVGVATVISIIIGGIQYSSAGGNAQAVSAAKARIRNAIIALAAFALLYAMLNFLIPGGLV